jgi:hypothetical protein
MGLERITDETDKGLPGTPMDIGTDRHKRYLLPDPHGNRDGLVPFTRASTVKGRAQKGESLAGYNERMIAKGLSISPDLVALAAATPLSQRGSFDVLSDVIEQAKTRAGARAAANLGSALHAFTEQVDKGEPVAEVLERVPAELQADVSAYVSALERCGLTPVPELIERVVVNMHLQPGLNWDSTPSARSDAAAGVAARFDRMYRWIDPADGVAYLVVGDLKTGKNAIEYGSVETCCQEAIAARATHMWNEDTEEYEDLPLTVASAGLANDGTLRLRTDVGLLIHLPVRTGTCGVERLDLDFGWRVAVHAVELMLIDKGKSACHRPLEPLGAHVTSALPAPTPAAAPTAEATPTGRRCHACGQTGHRRGSVKCSGPAAAPAPALAPVEEPEPEPAPEPAVERRLAAVPEPAPEPTPEPEKATYGTGPFRSVGGQSPSRDWAAEVAACTTRDGLQALRKEGMRAGEWTNELTRAGLDRLRSL